MKGTTPERRHRPIQRIKIFTRSKRRTRSSRDGVFRKRTTPAGIAAVGLTTARQGILPGTTLHLRTEGDKSRETCRTTTMHR